MAHEPAQVMRQALASMLWSKQHYHYDLDLWLTDRGVHPLRHHVPAGQRNANWYHMVNADVVSMPDKWEYPWYTAWDLAFHTVALATVDVAFAETSSGSCSTSGTSTRTARSRHTNGTSAT